MIKEWLNKNLGVNEVLSDISSESSQDIVEVVKKIDQTHQSKAFVELFLEVIGTVMVVGSTTLITLLVLKLVWSHWSRMGSGIRLLILHSVAFLFSLGLLRLSCFWSSFIFDSSFESGLSLLSGGIGISLVQHLYVFSKNTAEYNSLMSSILEGFTKEVLPKTRTGVWKWTFSTNMEIEKLEWDETMHSIFGSDPKVFGGRYRDFVNFIHPEDIEEVNKAVSEAINKGIVFNYKMRVTNHAGGWKTMYGRGAVICDSFGKPIYMAGFNFPE